MSDGAAVALRDLRQPDSTERNAHLLSSGPGWAELELTDGEAPIPTDTPVEFQTSEAICLGHVEAGEMKGNCHRLRVRVDHFLALQDASCIQKLWSQEQSA